MPQAIACRISALTQSHAGFGRFIVFGAALQTMSAQQRGVLKISYL